MENIDYKKIGQRIRTFRELQGLTQETASERCQITTAFYGNIERGDRKMSLETLVKISIGLGVSADSLLFGEKPQKKELLDEILGEIQRSSDEKQFEKYLVIIRTLATVIDKL